MIFVNILTLDDHKKIIIDLHSTFFFNLHEKKTYEERSQSYSVLIDIGNRFLTGQNL